MEQQPTHRPANPNDPGKTMAIVSYLTIIGWIIAFVKNKEQRSELTAYHLRQAAMLMAVAVVLNVGVTILARIPGLGLIMGILSLVVSLGLLVFWIMGIIAAASGEQKPLPVIGQQAQSLFASI